MASVRVALGDVTAGSDPAPITAIIPTGGSGIAAGDALVAFAANDSNVAITATEAGWTASAPPSVTQSMQSNLWRQILAGSPEAQYGFQGDAVFAALVAVQPATGGTLSFADVDPPHAAGGTQQSISLSGGSIVRTLEWAANEEMHAAAVRVDDTHGDSVIVCFWANDSGLAVAVAPVGMTHQTGASFTGAAGQWAVQTYTEVIASGGDTTPPTLSNASATATGSTTAAGSVDTDEAGTADAVLTTSATPPTATQIQAGQDHTGTAAAASHLDVAASVGTVNFTFTGLSPATTYYMHAVVQDAATNDSAVATTASFTTSAAVVQSEAVAFVEDESLAATPAATHIAGTVTEGGTPVEGLAVIALNRTTDTATIAQTDSSGTYVIAGLTPGTSYMVIPEVHEDTGTFYRANPAIREPSVNGD